MEEPIFGQCPLCLQQRQLEKSHYLGRALHLLSQDDGKAVFMTPQRIELSPRQIWAHLLCGDCEDVLAANESYAHQWIHRKDRFPLLERMNVAAPIRWTPNGTKFSGIGLAVRTERLAHFALGIFWRASAKRWRTLGLQTTSIDLGALPEPMRLYLRGEGPFPTGCALLMTVCTDHGSQGLLFAPNPTKGGIYPAFSMLVRGIKFTLVLGDNLPEELREACCVGSSRKVIFLRDCAADAQHAFSHLYQTAGVDLRLQ
jgi:hypothetical protein